MARERLVGEAVDEDVGDTQQVPQPRTPILGGELDGERTFACTGANVG